MLQVGGKAMHELDYSSRSLMQLCKTRHPFCSIPRGYLIASALLLRAAYDSPGVTCLDVRSPHVGVFRRKCAVTQGILRGRSTRSSWCPQSRKAGVPGSHVTDCPAAKCARNKRRDCEVAFGPNFDRPSRKSLCLPYPETMSGRLGDTPFL